MVEAQEGLEEVLATGGPGLKVGDALELYASVNATRKKVAHAFERHMSTVFPVYTLGMLIALYDFEVRTSRCGRAARGGGLTERKKSSCPGASGRSAWRSRSTP